jgi:hypothetical protein
VRANEVNAVVQWRDDFVRLLTTIVLGTDVEDPAALIKQLDLLIARIASAKPGSATLTPEQYEERMHAVEKLVPPDKTLDGERRAIFDRILFILDHVADLQEKRKLWFEVIGHEVSKPLAGSQVMGFAGFFEEQWRIYDYRRGRVDAHRALSGWVEAEGHGVPERAILGVYDREDTAQQPTRDLETPFADGNDDYLTADAYWQRRTGVPAFPRVTWNDITPDLQDALVERVLDRVLKAFHPNFGVKLLLKQFGKGKLRDILAGSAGEGGERLAPGAPPSRPRADA